MTCIKMRGGQRSAHTDVREYERTVNRTMYICFILLREHYRKFSGNTIHHLRALSVNSLGGLCSFLCSWAHKVKSNVQTSSSYKPGGAGVRAGEGTSRLVQVVGRIQFCVWWLDRGLCPLALSWEPLLLSCHDAFASSSPSNTTPVLPCFESEFSFCHTCLTLAREGSLLLRAHAVRLGPCR